MVGIRHGRPLSLTCSCCWWAHEFSDLNKELCTTRQQEQINGILFADVLHAEDTLLFCASAHCINVFLLAVEGRSKFFGLQMNYDKYAHATAIMRISSVRFSRD